VVYAVDCVYGDKDGMGSGNAAAIAAALGLNSGRAVVMMRSGECAFHYGLRLALRQAMGPSASDRDSILVHTVSILHTKLLSISRKLTLLRCVSSVRT
jgi:hypothetical protein